MAQPKFVFAALFLVLTLFIGIQSIEGRHLKFEKKYGILKSHSDKIIDKRAYDADDVPPSAPMLPLPPSQALGKTQPPPPPPPKNAVDFRPTTPPKNAVDFRPTTPGHSPGVGHSIQN